MPWPDRLRAWVRRWRVPLGVVMLGLALLARPFDHRARAASLLVRFADADARGWLASYGRYTLDESLVEVPTSWGVARGRLYRPVGAGEHAGVVLVHGVHRLGIDEPRLQRLARALASAGVTVLTPEVREIADYRVDPASIETIGGAVHDLHTKLGRPVGLIGTSFAGGLSLLTASEPRFAPDVRVVLAVGAQHDLRRVLRFFRTNEVPWPDGHVEKLTAHPYGPLVFLYAHIDQVCPPDEAPVAADVMRLWLWDRRDEARARLKDLPAASQARLEALLDGKGETAALLERLARDEAQTLAVSPTGHLGGLRADVFLLHGAGDNVIPAAETAWLAREIPAARLRSAVITSAIEHVELRGQPSLGQQWELVSMLNGVLEAVRE